MRIAVDAMGGDNAPQNVVNGAMQAAESYGVEITLVGDETPINQLIARSKTPDLLSVVHAPEIVENREHPAIAVRRKKNSSIVKATQLVKTGEADAVVSAGSTGASMACALLNLGRIKGIDRPALALVIPSATGSLLLLDVGANVDCKPNNLYQFAMMGGIYAQRIMGVNTPKVGLISNGEEDNKGNEVVLATFPLLQNSGLNFIGNVEGGEVFKGVADVLVCDGFVGNIALKTVEGLAELLFSMLKEEITKSTLAKLGLLLAANALKSFQKRVDYDEYGGAPLLGVNGVSVVCHGRSSPKAITNAIRVAMESVNNDLPGAIRDTFKSIDKKEVEQLNAQGSG